LLTSPLADVMRATPTPPLSREGWAPPAAAVATAAATTPHISIRNELIRRIRTPDRDIARSEPKPKSLKSRAFLTAIHETVVAHFNHLAEYHHRPARVAPGCNRIRFPDARFRCHHLPQRFPPLPGSAGHRQDDPALVRRKCRRLGRVSALFPDRTAARLFYSHGIIRRLKPKQQWLLHAALLLTCLALLPVVPDPRGNR